jgi:Domain of unknown function (DUF4157)
VQTPATKIEKKATTPSKASSSFFGSGAVPFFQPKLTVNQPGDAHEQEADQVADQVMRMDTNIKQPAIGGNKERAVQQMTNTNIPFIQRACAACEQNGEETLQRKETANDAGGAVAPSIVADVLSTGAGQALDVDTKGFMESRMGQDFSQVRVHTDARAAESASAIQAKAYTSGRNVVFGAGEYQPGSDYGKRLLAHELVHVVQQGHNTAPGIVSRFSDTGHHVVEEYGLRQGGLDQAAVAAIKAADTPDRRAMMRERYNLTDSQISLIQASNLSGALRMTEEQIEGVHQGNTERDYSQMPGRLANLALLGRFQHFGGYHAEDHFDNFIFDVQTQKWRSRQIDFFGQGRAARKPPIGPLEYISAEFDLVAEQSAQTRLSEREKMIHVGNAFHAVEDFFAHSNFTELIQNDYRHGRDLLTANLEGPSDSIPNILGSTAAVEMREMYRQQAETAHANAPPTSHTLMNKDHPGSHNYLIARRLAALVIAELTTDLLIALLAPSVPARKAMLRETVMAKLQTYLRPPSPDNPWWERIQSRRSTRLVDSELDRIQSQTPETVNQSMFSPLRNLEASSETSMRFITGVAVPLRVGNTYIWLQAGALGLSAPGPEIGDGRRDDPSSGLIWGGAQISGRFDWP